MSLDELKKRATAGELTLIEATEKAVRLEGTLEVKKKVLEYVMRNPPERLLTDSGTMREWFARLDKHLNPEEP